MSFTSNIVSGIFKKTKKAFKNKYRKIGLTWIQVRRLKNLPEKGRHKFQFLDGMIHFINRYEFLKSVDEIFIKEIYKTSFDSPNPLILDCGANIGLSVLYFKKLSPGSTIIAFEPDETNYNLLRSNIASMKLSNVDIRKEAVWIEDTTLQFIEEGTMCSRIESPLKVAENKNGPTKSIKAVRLKSLLTDKIDFLKIDIEGAEYEVLLDIQDKLHMVEQLFIEYHGLFEENAKLETMLSILTKNHFKYYLESVPVYDTPFSRKKNGLFDVQQNIYAFRS